LALLSLPLRAAAALRPIGGTPVQLYRPAAHAFGPQAVDVLYQPEPENLQIQLPGFRPGAPLNARLALKTLPHYAAWVAQQTRDQDLKARAISALLAEIGERPVVALTLGPMPAQGRAELHLGLMDGRRFELYARVQGQVASSARGLVFEPQSLVCEKASASAAWAVLGPLARAQATRIAGQRSAPRQ
jgi:hypothetical protein